MSLSKASVVLDSFYFEFSFSVYFGSLFRSQAEDFIFDHVFLFPATRYASRAVSIVFHTVHLNDGAVLKCAVDHFTTASLHLDICI